jgi:hypothetical protein
MSFYKPLSFRRLYTNGSLFMVVVLYCRLKLPMILFKFMKAEQLSHITEVEDHKFSSVRYLFKCHFVNLNPLMACWLQ